MPDLKNAQATSSRDPSVPENMYTICRSMVLYKIFQDLFKHLCPLNSQEAPNLDNAMNVNYLLYLISIYTHV